MKEDLIFVGYRAFTSKSNKECYVLEFITKPRKSPVSNGVYTSQVSVFTTSEKYDQFIENNKLLSIVQVPFEINGDRVHYSI